MDDLDGGPAARTTHFSWGGVNYEIDLSRANQRAFEKAIKPYVEAARRVRGTRTGRGRSTTAKHDLSAVREWASANGFDVAPRGRVSAAVLEAYTAAR
jgi:hypothetical protein